MCSRQIPIKRRDDYLLPRNRALLEWCAGTRGKLPPPIDDIESFWTPFEKEKASAMLNRSFVGSGETVRAGLEHFVEETGVDELIVASAIYEHSARLRSYEILSKVRN